MSTISSVGSTTYLNSNGRVSISQPIALEQPADYSTRVSISDEAIALNNETRSSDNAILNQDIASPSTSSSSIVAERAIEGQRQALGVVRDYEEQTNQAVRVAYEQNVDATNQELENLDTRRQEVDLDELSRDAREEAQRNLEAAQREIDAPSQDYQTSTNRTSTENIDNTSNEASLAASAANSTYQAPTESSLNRAPQEGYSGTNTQSGIDFIV